jgi:hypothetical protein
MTDIRAIAARHGFSEAAVRAIAKALEHSGGTMAQFDHPELGGMGQWSAGMLMIGSMNDDGLKARVRALMEELADAASAARKNDVRLGRERAPGERAAWWPRHLGSPASSGGQNGIRYAVFPDSKSLAVERNGEVTIYDTGERRLSGASQQQGREASLRFSGPDGDVDLDALPVVP